MNSLVPLAEVVGVPTNTPAATFAPVLVAAALADVVGEGDVDLNVDNDSFALVSAVDVLQVVVLMVARSRGGNDRSGQGKDGGNRVLHVCGWDGASLFWRSLKVKSWIGC